MGEVLGARRKDIVLATKFGMQMDQAGVKKGGSRRYIMAAAEDLLRRLKTDWIDLYQLHRPDSDTPIEETLRALDDLVHQGKVRYVGVSNMPAWQVIEAQWTGTSRASITWSRARTNIRCWRGTLWSANCRVRRRNTGSASSPSFRWRAARSPANTVATWKSRRRPAFGANTIIGALLVRGQSRRR